MRARGGRANRRRRPAALGSAIVHDDGRVEVLVSSARSDRHGPESLFVIDRNQRSTLSEYGPVAVLHRLSPKATRRTLRKRVAVGDRKVPVRVVTCGDDLGRVLGLGAQPGPCGAESGDALISLVVAIDLLHRRIGVPPAAAPRGAVGGRQRGRSPMGDCAGR